MRLIDADHVLTLEEMQKMFTGETCCMKSSIQRVLSLFPTVEAVPVVRCKDCVYLEKLKYGYTCYFHDDDDVELDDYCSRGLRNDGKGTK